MGKRKGGFNWKARQQNETIIDRSSEKKIKLDPEIVETNKEDESNILVLPSEKRKSKAVIDNKKKVKPLSKKERKRLEKVLENKAKKTKRAELLESLSKVQASKEELLQFASVAEMQTGKFKKKLNERKQESGQINSVAKSKGNKKSHDVSDQSEEETDSDSSVHTSDMSTDEEMEADDNKGEGQIEAKSEDQGQTSDSGCDVKLETEAFRDNQVKKGKDSKSETQQKEIKLSNDEQVTVERKPVVNIPVQRLPEIQEARLKLPILAEEQVVMETIMENMVTIICGETGSGKTTQVPQFLYEAGYAHNCGIIGVTEPRRVAAISMSNRVAKELNLTSKEVSYQIRYEGNVSPDTKIKFLTDGVLLKEVQKDFLLTKYSVVIIDEAHERSVYTDILIGLLSRIVPLRNKQGKPLKLIIMSATLRVEDFTENRRLFKVQPPVVKVDSRQFPVTIHFNKRTPVDDYLNEAFRKISKIHRMLPEGGILVFVTGQQEVHTLCQRLRRTFPIEGKVEPKERTSRRKKKEQQKAEVLPKINLDNYSIDPIDEEAEREGGGDSEVEDDLTEQEEWEEEKTEDDLQTGGAAEPLYVLPLYSLLSKEKQNKVFDPPPEGCRLCVVATNVAETSLTIPNIKYVVDTGKVKTKFYDKVTGVSTFKITWTSKASANQRAGRAGRVGPGHCYRLYSSAVYNDDFEKFSPAEILRRPVDDLVLQMKYMNIDRIVNFPFPTPPDDEQIIAAEQLLVSLGALTQPAKAVKMADLKKVPVTKITPLGKVMACFPVSPRYAKMLALGHQQDLLVYVVAIVAGLSVQEVFVEIQKAPETDKEKNSFRNQLQYMSQIKRLWAGSGHSMLLGDLMVLLKAIGSAEYQGCTSEFCHKNGLRMKAMKEVRKLRAQLTNTVNMVIPDANICLNPKLEPPNDVQAKLLRQIVLSGLADHVARRYPDPPPDADDNVKKTKHAYQCTELEEPVFIHPTSVLYKQRPEFIVYQYIQETSKLYMKGISAIEPEWLPMYATTFCTMSKPQDDPPPVYIKSKDQIHCHMSGTFGRCCWEIPSTELEFPPNLDRYRWFSRFLLEGLVIPGFKKYIPDLLTAPSTMVKSWAKLQPRTEVLLKELVSAGVDSKESLLAAWEKNPKYLFRAFSQWIPQSKHIEVEMSWPPIKR